MRLLCFGDSNTYGYDPHSYFGGRYDAQNRWVDLLAQKTGWELFNAGQNGREIPRRSREFTQIQQLLALSGPVDAFLVMLGDNDLLQGASVETVLARMEAFLSQLPSVCGKIILIAPPPLKRGAWVPDTQLLEDVLQLAEHYQTLAHRLGIEFVDTRDWNLELTFDGVHFSEEGNILLGQNIAEAIKKLLK